MPREIKVAQLENCIADDALKTLEGFDFPTGEGERTVQEIMMPIELYAIGEILERLEKYKFAQNQQHEGESMDTFLADLRILIIIILVLPPAVVCPSNCALPMSGTVDGDVVSRCHVLGRAASIHHGTDHYVLHGLPDTTVTGFLFVGKSPLQHVHS